MTDIIRAGIIGWPVSHSLSPRLHKFWLKKFNINGSYEAIPVKSKNLGVFVKNLQKKGYCGVNVTVPHKETVMAYCDEISETAQRVGAVNTLIINDKGFISGRNTDVYGFCENLKYHSDWQNRCEGPAIVLGAGGASRAICVALQDMGYDDIRIINRNKYRAEQLAIDLGPGLQAYGFDEIGGQLSDAQFLVNTTSLGMSGNDSLKIDLSPLSKSAVVADIVYNPLETAFLKQAKARGNIVIDGIGMLLYQAIPGFNAWFQPPDSAKVDENLRQHVLAGL